LVEGVHDLLGPLDGGEQVGDVHDGCAGGDAVEGGGEALGDDEALAAALGAAVPVGEGGEFPVEELDEGFADDGLLVD